MPLPNMNLYATSHACQQLLCTTGSHRGKHTHIQQHRLMNIGMSSTHFVGVCLAVATTVLVLGPTRCASEASVEVNSAAHQHGHSNAHLHRVCALWNCTCQGFSDTFGAHWRSPGRVRDSGTEWKWWVEQRCDTVPKGFVFATARGALKPSEKRDASVVSIMSFSRGQSEFDENMLLNAL